MEAAVCEVCDWSFLLPQGEDAERCPHCFQAGLSRLGEKLDRLPYVRPPEQVAPFTVTGEQLGQSIRRFARGIWFAPRDLNPQALQARLQRLYLPVWLVDSYVEALWQAEAGFDYQVVSHRDHFDQNRNGWVSEQVTETRIRWEPRLGRLARSYPNVVAPALEEHAELRKKLGQYNLKTAQDYTPEAVAGAWVRLPNRVPEDAWPEAVPAIQTAAARECRQACRSDHLRQFHWTAQYRDHHWTLLLWPVYVTYYLDDQRQPQSILIHGQSGQLHGPRRASMRRARQTAMIIGGVAVVIFILSLIAALISLLVGRLLTLAVVGLILAILVGAAALLPPLIAWQFNRTN